MSQPNIVYVDFKDLGLAPPNELNPLIAQAFGIGSLGLIVVQNVPSAAELRKEILTLAPQLWRLPEEEKAQITDAESMYANGWSFGKEMFNGYPDTSKCSFYANPIYDVPFEEPELIKNYPTMCRPNVWPARLPALRKAFRKAGQMLVSTGEELLRRIDEYVYEQIADRGYERNRLSKLIRNSRVHKGRLLYYLPKKTASQNTEDRAPSWCGWHNDHGTFTGLLCPMYFREESDDYVEKLSIVKNTDTQAGLWVATRSGEMIHVEPKEDELIFQIGESAQILTGGVMQATPHCVRGPSQPGISRATMAVFMDLHWDTKIAQPPGISPEEVVQSSLISQVVKGIPPLSKRWTSGAEYYDFSERTFKEYLNA